MALARGLSLVLAFAGPAAAGDGPWADDIQGETLVRGCGGKPAEVHVRPHASLISMRGQFTAELLGQAAGAPATERD